MSGDETALLAFSSIRTPALVLHAEASAPWICAAARSLASVLDNATVVGIPEDGWDFRLSAIAATLTEWLSSDSVTPSSSDASVGTYAG